jgi:hypothetical protein
LQLSFRRKRPVIRVGRLILLLIPLAITTVAFAQGGPPFITDDPGTPGNRHWEINFGWIADHNPGQAYYQLPDIDMNYGWGDRIQLKYELPLAAATDQNNTTRAGLGESLLGIKWRPYEHHRAGEPKSDENMNFLAGHLSAGFHQQPHQRRAARDRRERAAVLSAGGVHGQMGADRFRRRGGPLVRQPAYSQPLGARADRRPRVQRAAGALRRIYDLQDANRIGTYPSSAS